MVGSWAGGSWELNRHMCASFHSLMCRQVQVCSCQCPSSGASRHVYVPRETWAQYTKITVCSLRFFVFESARNMGHAFIKTLIVVSTLKNLVSSVESNCVAPAVPGCAESPMPEEKLVSNVVSDYVADPVAHFVILPNV